MKPYKMILGAIAAFDLTYLCFACVEDCYSRLHSRWKKKHGTDDDLDFLNLDEDEDFSLAPPLCVDAIRMVSPFHIRELVEDRILPQAEDLMNTLEEAERESAVLLLTSYISFLVQKAPAEEQNFPMLLELLNASKVYRDSEIKNAIDLLMEEDAGDSNPFPKHYADYQRYKITCAHKELVVSTCRVMISDIIKNLYGNHYDWSIESVLKPMADRLEDAKEEFFDQEVE